MKNIFKNIAAAAVGILAFTACSPEEFEGANGVLPLVSDYESNFNITVDPETNYATFEFSGAQGVSPIWIIDGAYSTDFISKKFYRKKGTYSVECKVKNKNGISDGSITKSFEILKTKMNGFPGFVEDSDFNLWKGVTFDAPEFWYAPGWSQTADPAYSYVNGAYTVSLPQATSERWQAQMKVKTGIAIASGKNYDFSVVFTGSKPHSGIKIKICDADDEGIVLLDKDYKLKEADEPQTFWAADVEGKDISNVKVIFDFGGNAENTDLIIESFVLKDHANDDGTEIPAIEPDWVDEASSANLMNGGTLALGSTYWATNDWQGLEAPTVDINGNTAKVTANVANGTTQWQGQVHLNTGVKLEAGKIYDFRVILNASKALGATVKAHADGKDDKENTLGGDPTVFQLNAGADTTCFYGECAGFDTDNLVLTFDFPGCDAGTTIDIKGIIIQEHR